MKRSVRIIETVVITYFVWIFFVLLIILFALIASANSSDRYSGFGILYSILVSMSLGPIILYLILWIVVDKANKSLSRPFSHSKAWVIAFTTIIILQVSAYGLFLLLNAQTQVPLPTAEGVSRIIDGAIAQSDPNVCDALPQYESLTNPSITSVAILISATGPFGYVEMLKPGASEDSEIAFFDIRGKRYMLQNFYTKSAQWCRVMVAVSYGYPVFCPSAVLYSQFNADCFIEMSKNPAPGIDVNFCEQAPSINVKDACVYNLALILDNENICQQASSEGFKTSCLLNFRK